MVEEVVIREVAEVSAVAMVIAGEHDKSMRKGILYSIAKAVYVENGWRGYWRGFLPCFLRAFPANAMALVAFEGVMRALP